MGVIERNDPATLLHVPIVISLNTPDCNWSEQICLQLATHEDFNVRANALLGFGHLARLFRRLTIEKVLPLIITSLNDPHPFVRSHAHSAIDDIETFLEIRVPRELPPVVSL